MHCSSEVRSIVPTETVIPLFQDVLVSEIVSSLQWLVRQGVLKVLMLSDPRPLISKQIGSGRNTIRKATGEAIDFSSGSIIVGQTLTTSALVNKYRR